MNNHQRRIDLTSIESFNEIREQKQALKAEIDDLGKEITASAKDIVVKGAKATLTTVAVAIVTKGLATYLKLKRTSASSQVEQKDSTFENQDMKVDGAAHESKLQGILVYIDMLIKVVDSAKVVYSVIQRYREMDWEEE